MGDPDKPPPCVPRALTVWRTLTSLHLCVPSALTVWGTPTSLHPCVPHALTIEGDPQFSSRAPSVCLRNALSGQLPVSLRPRRGDLSFCLLPGEVENGKSQSYSNWEDFLAILLGHP